MKYSQYFLMQDQQRASLLNNPHFWDSSHPSSVYATPNNNMYNNPGQFQHLAYPAYYVDSPSTVALDINSDNFGYEEDQRTSERLSEPFSASLLSRSTSFLSNCTSERVSIPDVSARRQSWCKSIQESMATNKWETCDEEMSLEAKGERTRLRWLDILKSLISWLCITVLLVGFLMALFTSMYWLICHPQAPSTTFKVGSSSCTTLHFPLTEGPSARICWRENWIIWQEVKKVNYKLDAVNSNLQHTKNKHDGYHHIFMKFTHLYDLPMCRCVV